MAMFKAMSVQPVKLIVEMSDKSKVELLFTKFKPSRKSQKLNANAIAKIVLDGRMVQLGCNLTVLD